MVSGMFQTLKVVADLSPLQMNVDLVVDSCLLSTWAPGQWLVTFLQTPPIICTSQYCLFTQ